MQRPKTLSAALVKTVREPGRYGDGRGSYGLSLLVKESTTGRMSKSWSQRIRINGEVVMIGLGSYPAVTLAHARQKAIDNARAIAQGRDPRVKISTMPTFEEAAKVVMELNAPTWKDGGRSAQVWASSLTLYAYPVIGNKPVSEVTTADLMAVLTPIWTNKMETAKRLRTRMGQVFKWAIGKGYRSDNPAGEALLAAMPRQVKVVEHRKALAHAEVSRCLETIRQSGAWPGTKFSFELLTLTATRSGEVARCYVGGDRP